MAERNRRAGRNKFGIPRGDKKIFEIGRWRKGQAQKDEESFRGAFHAEKIKQKSQKNCLVDIEERNDILTTSFTIQSLIDDIKKRLFLSFHTKIEVLNKEIGLHNGIKL